MLCNFAEFWLDFALAFLGFFLCRFLLASTLPAGQPHCGLWLGQGLGRQGRQITSAA
jgi:hypothetical protein